MVNTHMPCTCVTIAPENFPDDLSETIDSAITDFQRGSIDEVIKTLSDPELGKKLGITILEGRKRIIDASTPINLAEVSNRLALDCAHFPSPQQQNSLQLGSIGIYDNSGDIPRELGIELLPKNLQIEIALIYLEEWCHELQSRSPKNSLTGIAENELDVAMFFLQKGIRPSRIWMQRYFRERSLNDYFDISVSNNQFGNGYPIKIGSLLNTRRSNGEIESNWVLEKYNFDSVVLRRGNLSKVVSRDEVLELNPSNCSTYYAGADNFVDLFRMIDEVGFFTEIQERRREVRYKPSEIKRIINLIRNGNNIVINSLPVEGGLRYAVLQLYNAEKSGKNLRQ